MLAICIETSHARGMGHFFRALILYEYLKSKEDVVILLNNDAVSINILRQKGYPFVIVDFNDVSSNWERRLIKEHGIDIWLNDKFYSSYELCSHVKQSKTLLVVIDDIGPGASMADIHFAGMLSWRPATVYGKCIYRGSDFIILNPEIKVHQRIRSEKKRLLVSLGGSDTYGVTIEVVKRLKELGIEGDIVIGPSFQHREQLEIFCGDKFRIFQNVPSLIRQFSKYDWMISGGGVTCLEACASGLPCIVIANEKHELYTAQHIEEAGCGFSAGFYKNIDDTKFLCKMEVETMSRNGMNEFTLNGCENIYHKICEYRSV